MRDLAERKMALFAGQPGDFSGCQVRSPRNDTIGVLSKPSACETRVWTRVSS
jgi:hypothetical protein